MAKIVITCESGSDVPPELARRYRIRIVPMHVSFGDTTKDDGFFPPQEILDYYNKTKKVPKTSGCSPHDFEKAFDEIHKAEPDAQILYLAYSAVTTVSMQSALIAAQSRDYVTAVDTKHCSMGQCAVVIKTAQLIEKHPEWSVKEAAEAARKVSERTRMAFLPDNLDYLRAGGRVSNAVAIMCNILNIHPEIEILNGYLIATKKLRGTMEKVTPRFIEDFANSNALIRDEIWFGYVPDFSNELQRLAEQTLKDCGFKEIHHLHTGCVITSHGGSRAFGIAGYTA